MGIRRQLFIGVILFVALGGTSAFASQTCAPATLATYIAPNFTCTEDAGVFIIKDFTFASSGGPGVLLTASDITVSPLPGNNIGFAFSGAFTAPLGGSATYTFDYFIDPPPIIHGEQIVLDPTGNVKLDTNLCVQPFSPTCPFGSELPSLHASTATQLTDSVLFEGNTSTLGVQNILTLDGTAGPATSGGFSNGTTVDSSLVAIPEPGSMFLAAWGLLGLLAFRARAKLRKIRF
jgi:PEP-CTERM motif